MGSFRVVSEGPLTRPLSGTVYVGGAKNSALKLMAAALLAPGRSVVHNVPDILDVAVMGAHDRRNDRKAETAAAGGPLPRAIRPPEALEDLPADLRRDALAMVDDGDGGDPFRRVDAHPDLDGTAGGREPQGVADQVSHHLANLVLSREYHGAEFCGGRHGRGNNGARGRPASTGTEPREGGTRERDGAGGQ